MDADVIIIGAGASGLVAAITAARGGSAVLVIEQKDKAGKKIFATGNGKCNFTNLHQSPDYYRSEDVTFPEKVLSGFDVRQTIHFFKELGIYPKEREGYLYPNSEQAASVVEVLLLECRRLGVKLIFGEKVIRIQKPDYTIITEAVLTEEPNKNNSKNKTSNSNGKKSISDSKAAENGNLKACAAAVPKNAQKKAYTAEKVILSCGGCASPKLGSDGSGYALAKSLGHTIIKPLPALVQLKSPDKFCRTLSGVRVTAGVTAFGNGRVLDTEEGEIIFTDYGISGIPVMQLSRFAAKALDSKSKVYLLIDFLPELSAGEIITLLQARIRQNPDKTTEEMMAGFFNNKLSYIFIREAGLEPVAKSKTLKQPDLIKLAKQIKEFMITITDTNSFENAQVCAGGVSTKEVDEKTLESKIAKKLFLTGELLDVDGTCGGYNLQWAWSTGYLAGSAAGRKANIL